VDGMAAKIARIEQHRLAIARATDLEVLRGYEGAAARLYFEAMGQLITNPGFSLTGRSRLPGPDGWFPFTALR
jgi:CRISP-associated protein Cas1